MAKAQPICRCVRPVDTRIHIIYMPCTGPCSLFAVQHYMYTGRVGVSGCTRLPIIHYYLYIAALPTRWQRTPTQHKEEATLWYKETGRPKLSPFKDTMTLRHSRMNISKNLRVDSNGMVLVWCGSKPARSLQDRMLQNKVAVS